MLAILSLEIVTILVVSPIRARPTLPWSILRRGLV